MPKLTLASGDHRPVPAWIRASTLLPFSTSCMVGTELAKQLGVLPEQYAVSLFLGDPGDWQVGSLDFEPKWTAMRLMRGSHSPRCGATNADCTPLCAETANPSKAVVRVDVHEAIGKTTRPPPALFDGDFLRRFTVHLEVSVDEPGQAGGECLPWSLVLDADFTVVDEDYTYDPDTYCPCHGGGRPPAPPVPADAPAGPLTK